MEPLLPFPTQLQVPRYHTSPGCNIVTTFYCQTQSKLGNSILKPELYIKDLSTILTISGSRNRTILTISGSRKESSIFTISGSRNRTIFTISGSRNKALTPNIKKWIDYISGSRNRKNGEFSGSRNRKNGAISGSRNRQNG